MGQCSIAWEFASSCPSCSPSCMGGNHWRRTGHKYPRRMGSNHQRRMGQHSMAWEFTSSRPSCSPSCSPSCYCICSCNHSHSQQSRNGGHRHSSNHWMMGQCSMAWSWLVSKHWRMGQRSNLHGEAMPKLTQQDQ